ncbi:MAG: hypothetical protein ABIL11_14020 [Chloroflexota bacterium]
MRYEFDWGPNKERANIRKHGLSFRQAAFVFRDQNQLSRFDEGAVSLLSAVAGSWI